MRVFKILPQVKRTGRSWWTSLLNATTSPGVRETLVDEDFPELVPELAVAVEEEWLALVEEALGRQEVPR